MKKILASLGNMLFPNICISCNNYLSFQEKWLCDYCKYTLPKFEDFNNPQNLVAQMFWGRVSLERASAYLQFKSRNQVQKVLHEIKYRGNRDLAFAMGKEMALYHQGIEAITHCDIIVPIPLHRKKVAIRGYNQSSLLAKGFGSIINKPVVEDALVRSVHTQTQTQKKRFERYRNTKNVFQVTQPTKFINSKVLLIDDVITTGATIEACAVELLKIDKCKVSVCSLAVSN